MLGRQFTWGGEKQATLCKQTPVWCVANTSPSPGRSSVGTLGRHLSTPFLEPLTLFSIDWFLCVASKMVMNCRYWGFVQRPMPGREGTGNSVRKARKQDEQVSGRELKMSQKVLEGEVRRKGTKGPGSGEIGDLKPLLPYPATGYNILPHPSFFSLFVSSLSSFFHNVHSP